MSDTTIWKSAPPGSTVPLRLTRDFSAGDRDDAAPAAAVRAGDGAGINGRGDEDGGVGDEFEDGGAGRVMAASGSWGRTA